MLFFAARLFFARAPDRRRMQWVPKSVAAQSSTAGLPVLGLCILAALAIAARLGYRRWRRRRLLLRLPSLPVGTELKRSTLRAAASAHRHLVRLPSARDGDVLLLDARLARYACNCGAFERDVSGYARYGGFLGGSLVLLSASSQQHRTLRSALLTLFQPAAVRRAVPALRDCAERLLGRLAALARTSADGFTSVRRPLQLFAIEAVGVSCLAARRVKAAASHPQLREAAGLVTQA